MKALKLGRSVKLRDGGGPSMMRDSCYVKSLLYKLSEYLSLDVYFSTLRLTVQTKSVCLLKRDLRVYTVSVVEYPQVARQ